MNKKYDVIVIGGGLAGLTAALYLAKSGKRVAVLDKGTSFGGRASTKDVSGSMYNLGPHAFYKKGKAVKSLEALGIRMNGGSPSLKGVVFSHDEAFTLPSDVQSVVSTGLLNWKEKKEFAYLMWKIAKINPKNYENHTLKQWVEQEISSERIQQVVYMFCRLACYTNAPEIVNAGVTLRQLQLSLGGALYVNRGWQSVIDQLTEKSANLGVDLVKQCKVEEIKITNTNKSVLYYEEGELRELDAESIVATVPPKELLRLVKGIEESQLGGQLQTCIPVRATCLDVTLKHLPNAKQHFSLDLDNAYYYSNHSKGAKLTYHPNHHVIHVMKYLTPQEKSIPEHLLATFLGKNQPNWREYLVTKRFMPNVIVSHRIHEPGKKKYLASALSEFPGLILAGEWVSDDWMLAEAAIHSAEEAVAILNGKESASIGS
ncbi:phytoene desaturase family protein [Metabacillus malikii]|uniref:Phytoene dehydrogenase-like protein n=1 Tax=Metabacillus malikii TaxID=1504265 RepID=A0ABT9ZHE0_9BACI|nr:FAD-dependent oxidoreductase [Metabacillus malikii]MDQ0231698.1 phytoene dehydrogenase-like protein [Metabacillus malikii]